MKLLKKQTFLHQTFLLLLSLFAIAIPVSAQELKEYVAGTEFEPNPRGSHPFYLKEYGNNSTSNSALAFNNANIFQQDIVVYDNVNYSSKLVHINQGYNLAQCGYTAANSTTVPLNKYIVARPNQLKSVGGLPVRTKDDDYSDNGMFITKTETGKTTCVLYYTIKNLKEGEAYQVKIGFVNLADKDDNAGSLAVKLRYKIHGIKKDGTIGGQLIENEWNLNAGVGIKVLQTQSSQIIDEDDMKNYTGLVLTILNNGSEANHVFGLDYINIYSKNNIVELEPTETPLSMNYDECVETPGVVKNLSDQVRLPKGYTGTLKIYEDQALTKTAPKTFNTGTVTNGTKTYYYTYQEDGKSVSETGTFTINVKPNPTITLSSDIKNNAITMCNALNMNLAATASVANGRITNMEWSLENETRGVYISEQTASGGATVAFNNGTGSIFGTADAIFTATAGNGCSTSNAANPVKLTNRNCAGLTLTGEVSKQEECEGNEITYTFKLENKLGFASEDIDVSLVLPESGFTVTSTTPSIDGNKWNVTKLSNRQYVTFTVKGTAQVTDAEAVSENFTLTAYVSRVGESTYNQENTSAISAQTVVVYNAASTPEFDMDDTKTISQCNNGTFEIVAAVPAIGDGAWTIAPNQDEELTKDVKIDLKDPKVQNVAIVSGVPLDKSVIIRWTVTNGVCADENNFVDIELKNDDCTKIDIDSDASLSSDPSKVEVCEGSEVTYTFTLTNKTGVDSEIIIVEFDFPGELTLLDENAITYTAGHYEDGVWTVRELPYVENPTSDDTPTLTIKGTVSLPDETIASKKVEVKGTIVKVANQELSPAPTSTSSVIVYNTPSEPELDMERLTSVSQCNDGEFNIKAVAPAIGEGAWSIAPEQEEEVVKDVVIEVTDSNLPNEVVVKGVPLGKTVKVRWTVSNKVCVDSDNFAELELTNNNCTTFEPSVDDAEVSTCYGSDATFTFTVKNTATVAVEDVKLSLSLESGLVLKEAFAGEIKFDENNQCVIPTMDSEETVTITVVATATVDKAKATISVIESSGVEVSGVSVSKAVTVYDLPEVSFAATSSTICIDEQDKENTKVQVNFTKGTPNFKLSYTIGEKSFNDILVEGNTHSIEEYIDANATISINKVVDSYGCENTDFGAIKHDVDTKKHATLGTLAELAETCEGTTLTLAAPTVTNNGSTVSNQKWVLNEEDFAPTTRLDFDAHNGQSIYYQVTSSCNGNTREIKTEPVTVTVINSNVTFDLVVADDKILTAGEKAQVTVVPVEKEAESYQWFANDKELPINGLEFSDYLYLNTEFKVIANGRCGVATNEASVEVVWPTAFTPYNGNGKNDDFAKGLPIVVFNRFYTKIFEGNDGWDGTINGSMNESESIAVPGVYYYAVTLPNGDVKKGTIEIIKID